MKTWIGQNGETCYDLRSLSVSNRFRLMFGQPLIEEKNIMEAPKLIAVTKPEERMSPEEFIAYQARVSSPHNQDKHDTAFKLLKYCLVNGHWSPFDMVDVTVEIHTSRAIMAQILRHWSFRFQEFCISGSSEITLESPGQTKRVAYKRTIEHLYKLQQSQPDKMPKAVRVFDETTRTFVRSELKEVFQTGIKPTFRITLENGKVIECTKEHKFLTTDGFVPLEYAIGLKMIGSKAVMTNHDAMLACNGVVCYQDKDWMLEAKQHSIANKTGVLGIAEKANVSYHTIRKWLKVHGLGFTKQETKSYTPSWNKGVKGYKNKPHSLETIKKMRDSAKKGSDSNLWKGGVTRAERLAIADWCATVRAELLIKADYKCNRCSSSKKLELHHIEAVAERPDLARDKNNLEVVCEKCHDEHHGLAGDHKKWREKSKGNTLTVSWSKVKFIEYIGEQMTYDLEVKHSSHNYIANGIVVHNSQRYAPVGNGVEPMDWSHLEARAKASSNRQGSGERLPDETFHLVQACKASEALYYDLLAHNVAPECARMALPLGVETRAYMKGSVRSFITYLWQRASFHHEHAQKEHRMLADQIAEIFCEVFPNIGKIVEDGMPMYVSKEEIELITQARKMGVSLMMP